MKKIFFVYIFFSMIFVGFSSAQASEIRTLYPSTTITKDTVHIYWGYTTVQQDLDEPLSGLMSSITIHGEGNGGTASIYLRVTGCGDPITSNILTVPSGTSADYTFTFSPAVDLSTCESGLSFTTEWSDYWGRWYGADTDEFADGECSHPGCGDIEDLYFVIKGKPAFLWPLSGSYDSATINSDYGDHWEDEYCDNPLQTKELWHTGIDIDADVDDSVYAVESGTVKYIYTTLPNSMIVIEHEDNDGKYTTTYMHIDVEAGLSVNDPVDKGDKIAEIADITGPHLHFQIRYDDYDSTWSLRGRLPEVACEVGGVLEPAFQEYFVDPNDLNWETNSN